MGKIKLDTNKKIKTEPVLMIKKRKKTNASKCNSICLPKDQPEQSLKIKLKQDDALDNFSVNETNENNTSKTVGTYVRPLLPIDFGQIQEAVVALLKSHELKAKTSTSLLEDERPIFLQINSMKVSKCSRRILRIQLPHMLANDLSDVCLIVTDLKRGYRVDHEPTVNYYEELLKSKGVTKVKSIIPIRQLKVEYDQYELKSRLLRSHDYFLVDSKISGHVFHLLGKIFKKKRKNPTPVRMYAENLKNEIDKALCKVPLYIHSNGDSHVVQVAHSQQKINHIAENVYSAIQALPHIYPGQWNNIRTLYLRAADGPAFPIYMTLKSRNTVKVPNMKSKRPAARKNVTGELSTIPNTTVLVHPGGDVKMIKNQKIKIEKNTTTDIKIEKNTTTDTKIETVLDVQTSKKRKSKNMKENNSEKKPESSSDSSEDEEFVSNVENTYLKNLEETIENAENKSSKPNKNLTAKKTKNSK